MISNNWQAKMLISEDSPGNILSSIKLENPEYKKLSQYILGRFGIKIPPNKKALLQSRLQRRLKTLKYSSFREYVEYLFTPEGQTEEVSNMIDAVSTNKTDFFREKSHFDFLTGQGLKEILIRSGKNRLNIWSAGCSSGEEPYTIAMVLKNFSENYRYFDYRILATDISESVLQHAANGIYHSNKIKDFPPDFRKKYLLKGKNAYQDQVRIIPELRNKIEFCKHNLLEDDYYTLGKFDIIFCRNVMIYFERDTQYNILKQFCLNLSIGGYLFLGHSESITGLRLPLRHLRPTIFVKTNDINQG